MMNRTTGRSAFLSLLKDEGITHLFGNPGTTELPVMHALKDHPELTYVMAMQESLVVAMADGFSRASGQLVACNVHVAPGLGNAMGSLYNARFTGTPMILTAGQQEQGHGLMEPLLYGPLVQMAEPLVKWAIEVTRLEDLPRIVRRAAKIATTPPTGPVFISLPGDILNAETHIEPGQSTRVDTRVAPSREVLDALVQRILSAHRPVVVVGDEIVKSDALDEAALFASRLGCPVYQQTIAYGAHFLSDHPCFMGALPRDQQQTTKILGAHDLLIVLGSDPVRMSVHSAHEPLPRGMPIIQIGLVDNDLAKNFPAEIALKADVRETLRVLVPAIEVMGGAPLATLASDRIESLKSVNWLSSRDRLVQDISRRKDAVPIDPDWLALQVVDALPANAILVDEGLTSSRYMAALKGHRDRYGYHQMASGGIGWGLPASVGASLANPERPVVCYSGDGSAMYSIQSLWTAAHHNLPLTVVLVNNGGYRIIKQRLQAFHGTNHFVGMDFRKPSVDFTGLARSLGVRATRVSEGDQFRSILASAIERRGPELIEVIVDGAI
ncbi:thiamine pyrophosphate-binding protein [Bradyrhizobium japonicum]|uniref:Benzoylformate decarboxylase n=1 Tax=Bradyrhizobium japonicum TaxID=375 RepID=A0A0A3XLI3_BRAJP|nr:thiamine pyrophosphate-dependent enzyme [Bradyrhizobium japonicum]KGT75262.1 benzoylformate decarboxylase [Bradyrhizobium japonicum]UQD77494.1 thiamine pyrophosphate-binding protein [Bradyrhizobium japonicum]